MYSSASAWQISYYQQMVPPPLLPPSQYATPGLNTSSPMLQSYDQSSSPVLQSYDQMSLTPAGASFNTTPLSFPQAYDQSSLLPATIHTPSPVGAASSMNVGAAAAVSSTTDPSSTRRNPGQNVTPPAPVIPRG